MVSGGWPAPERREFVVVGAGLLGLATARALLARGRDVVVFEQASVGHHDGGSHGSARIFRLGYPDPGYVALARRAHGLWRELESSAGQQLLLTTGQLTFGPRLGEVGRAMREAGVPCETLSAGEAADRFPAIKTGGPCLYEAQSCVIAAGRVLAALAAGVPDIRSGQPVTRVEPEGNAVTVRAGEVRVTARAAVVCAGPWTAGLLRPVLRLPLTATLEQAAYVARAGSPPSRVPRPPIFLRYGDRSPYGLPLPGSDLYKVGVHPSGPAGGPSRAGPVVAPGFHGQGEDARLRAELMAVVRQCLRGYDPEPVRAERCVYDNSPDEDFVVDRAGPLVIGCGTSGHGFKFGPLLGEWLADLATGQEPAGMPGRFSADRFRPR